MVCDEIPPSLTCFSSDDLSVSTSSTPGSRRLPGAEAREPPLWEQGLRVYVGCAHPGSRIDGSFVIILLALLLLLLFAGLGFALHFLWVVAVVLLVAWLIGLALGRGESAGSHRFYRMVTAIPRFDTRVVVGGHLGSSPRATAGGAK